MVTITNDNPLYLVVLSSVIYMSPPTQALYLHSTTDRGGLSSWAEHGTAHCYSLLLSLPASCKSRYYANNIASPTMACLHC